MYDPLIFGANLGKIKKQRKMTVQHIASAAGVSYYTVRGYLDGRQRPSVKALVKLAEALSVTPNKLLDGMCPRQTEHSSIEAYKNNIQRLSAHSLDKVVDIFIQALLDSAPSFIGAENCGERIRVCRMEAGCSVGNFAKLCKISQSTLSNIEAHQSLPSIDVFLDICELLHASPSLLLGSEVMDSDCPEKLRNLTPKQLYSVSKLTKALLHSLHK